MSSNKLVTYWYNVASHARNALETGGQTLQNRLYLSQEWAVAVLKYKLKYATCQVTCSFYLLK